MRPIYTLLCIVLFISSCQQEEMKRERTGRVVLCYIAADNSLSSEAEEKVSALLSEWNPLWGELLFYVDKRGKCPELRRAAGVDTSELLCRYPEENSASAATFGKVMEVVAERYPKAERGMIFFSHASGWLPERALAASRSIGQDGNHEMSMQEAASAIPDGFFDFIVFEACFMGGVEVAYEWRDKADYLLVSAAEIISPGFTPIYGQALHYLYEPAANLQGFAQTYADYCNRQYGYRKSFTLSLVRTAEVKKLASLTKAIPMPETDDTAALQHFDRNLGYGLFFDLMAWVKWQSRDEILIGQIEEQLNKCVVWKAYSPEFMVGYRGFMIDSYSGLTTYLMQPRFADLNAAYKELSWYRAGVKPE